MPPANPPDLPRLIAAVEALTRETKRLRGDVGRLTLAFKPMPESSPLPASEPIDSVRRAFVAMDNCRAIIVDIERDIAAIRSQLNRTGLRADWAAKWLRGE